MVDAGEGLDIADTRLVGTRVPLCKTYAARKKDESEREERGG